VGAAALPHRREALRERVRQADPIRRLGQQRSPGVGDDSLSVRRDIYGEFAAIALHLHGDPLERCLRVSAPAEFRFRRDETAPWMTRGAVSS
jgi:hypothetical protein